MHKHTYHHHHHVSGERSGWFCNGAADHSRPTALLDEEEERGSQQPLKLSPALLARFSAPA